MVSRYLLLVILLALPGRSVAWAQGLDSVVLDSAEIPDNWTLIDEERAFNTDAMRGVVSAVRQQWRYKDEPFTVLYFLCDGLERAAQLYKRHALLFGEDAVVAPLGTIVVEIHGAPSEVWADAGVLLGFDLAQQRKLVAAALPKGWDLVGEFLASSEAVAQAATTLKVPVQLILVQQLRSAEGVVHVNFVLCADGDGAAEVYERYSATNPETFVALQGSVIVELIGDHRRLLLPTLELLEAAPLLPQRG